MSEAFQPTRGIRNNNPGNIERTHEQWLGMSKDQHDERFIVFNAPEYGLRAIMRLIRNYGFNDYRTLRSIANHWLGGDHNHEAPRSEGDVHAYCMTLCRETGYLAELTLDTNDVTVRMKVARAIVIAENQHDPYSAEVWNRAATLG